MMRRIFKYAVPVPAVTTSTILTHRNPSFLSCAFQEDKLVVWAEVDLASSDEATDHPVIVAVIPTGGKVLRMIQFSYLGTAIHQTSGIVMHVYVDAKIKR